MLLELLNKWLKILTKESLEQVLHGRAARPVVRNITRMMHRATQAPIYFVFQDSSRSALLCFELL